MGGAILFRPFRQGRRGAGLSVPSVPWGGLTPVRPYLLSVPSVLSGRGALFFSSVLTVPSILSWEREVGRLSMRLSCPSCPFGRGRVGSSFHLFRPFCLFRQGRVKGALFCPSVLSIPPVLSGEQGGRRSACLFRSIRRSGGWVG